MDRRWSWVAGSMLAIYLLTLALQVPLWPANGTPRQQPGFLVALLVAFTAFMVVGAVIVAHRPGNLIGWIFVAIGLLAGTGTLALEYAIYTSITRPGSLPGAVLAARVSRSAITKTSHGLTCVNTPILGTLQLPLR